jgi:hypothetical protein
MLSRIILGTVLATLTVAAPAIAATKHIRHAVHTTGKVHTAAMVHSTGKICKSEFMYMKGNKCMDARQKA